MMQDFYFEKTRASETEDWPDAFTLPELADALGVERVSYRIYYSKDNLTCRLFVFRPHCTSSEEQKMLDLGFVHAQDGDTENIPDKSKMNERIRQLVEQAGGHFGEGLEFAVVFGELEDFEKFAELIVRECANRASWAQDTGEADIGGEVLKHFGVEE
jgi:hypothetical protein